MDTTLRIAAVGDLSTGDHPVCVGHGMRHAFRKHGGSLFKAVKHLWSDADVVMGNLESVTSDLGLKKVWLPSYEMRGDPASLELIREAGFNLLGIANNHAMQHGPDAFHDMLTHIQTAGLHCIGLDDQRSKTIPYRLKCNDAEHIFFAVSQRPEEWYGGKVPYSLRRDADVLVREVEELRRACSGFLICSIHWGLEFLKLPGREQVLLGRQLVDAGADVVFGHHSHLLQPVERYKHGLIFYSLGNFAFDMWEDDMKLTAVASVTLKASERPKYEIVPIVIGEGYCLRPATGGECELIRDRTRERNREEMIEILRDSSASYFAKYQQARQRARKRMYKYFLRRALEYPPHWLVQSLGRTALRRLAGR